MNKYFIIFLCVCLANVLNANEQDDYSSNSMSISELLHNPYCLLAIEPYIPENYVAMSPMGSPNLWEWVYLGPKEVLESYFKKPDSLDTPLLRVKFSHGTFQTGPKTFNEDANERKFLEFLKKKDPDFFEGDIQWGNYPVHTTNVKMKEKKLFLAHVGLNEPDYRWTLLFNLVYPEKEGHPTADDQDFWNNFINKTKQIPEYDFFKAHGQDLQPGYTLLTVGENKFKITAEKRQSDGKVQVVIFPLSTDLEFEFDSMHECLFGFQWDQGKPSVKICGKILKKEGDNKEVIEIDQLVSILLQTVPEFSVDKEEMKSRSDLFIYQN